MRVRLEGGELFHVDGLTDRQTDMTKLIVAFHNFSNAPKNTLKSNFHINNILVYNSYLTGNTPIVHSKQQGMHAV